MATATTRKTPATLGLAAPITLRAAPAADSPGDKLPRFDMVAYTGGIIRPMGWGGPVVVDLAGLEVDSQKLPIRFAHKSEWGSGVGHTETVTVAASLLTASGVISRDTITAREVVVAAGNGFPWQASIGADVLEVEFLREGVAATINGQKVTGPLDIVRRAKLKEISIVDIGADPDTTTTIAASGENQGGKTVPETPINPATGEPTSADIIGRAKAGRERTAAIRALAEEYSSIRGVDLDIIQEITARAEADGASVQDTELALLRATRPKVIQQTRRGDPHVTQAVLEASLCMSAGISDERLAKDRDYGEKVVELAWKYRSRGLRGTLAAALEMQGVSVPHGSRELFSALLESQRIRASGFSTVNIPGIIGNVANKILTQSFLDIETSYDKVADQADFSNFHTHTIYRLDHTGEFQQIPPTGEIKHGSLGEESYENKLETYGTMLTLSRQNIINDDLNSFTRIIQLMSRKGRIAADKALYLEVMEGSDVFYTAGRGNLITSNPLSIAGLGAAEAALMLMADVDGDPIYATGRYLLVPPQLKPLADSLYTSTSLNETTTANAGKPMDNPYKGRFIPVTSPFLATSTMGGYSATTWYLIADPRILPAFQIAFLDGRRAPIVETEDAEFNTLGMSMRCYWDFGTAQLDYRGVIKNRA